jgi:hypothetical protein
MGISLKRIRPQTQNQDALSVRRSDAGTPRRLLGHVALVTEAGGEIGGNSAVALAHEGADVVMTCRESGADIAFVERRVAQYGCRYLTLCGDPAGKAFCETAVRRAVETFGRLDILVNNVTVRCGLSSMQLPAPESFRDLSSMIHMTRAALPYVPERESIINTLSVTVRRDVGPKGAWTLDQARLFLAQSTEQLFPGMQSPFRTLVLSADCDDEPWNPAAAPEELALSCMFVLAKDAPLDSLDMTGQMMRVAG